MNSATNSASFNGAMNGETRLVAIIEVPSGIFSISGSRDEREQLDQRRTRRE